MVLRRNDLADDRGHLIQVGDGDPRVEGDRDDLFGQFFGDGKMVSVPTDKGRFEVGGGEVPAGLDPGLVQGVHDPVAPAGGNLEGVDGVGMGPVG